jgi:hypothetical protein
VARALLEDLGAILQRSFHHKVMRYPLQQDVTSCGYMVLTDLNWLMHQLQVLGRPVTALGADELLHMNTAE